MATYKYKAISKADAKVSGTIEAYDEFDAIDRIRETCKVVLSVTKVSGKDQKGISLPQSQINYKTLALFCSQFAIILTAGISVVRAVELIQEQVKDKTLKKVLKLTAEDVSSGQGLALSLEIRGGKIFPRSFIETVKSGEVSGTLEKTFHKLQKYYDQSFKVKAKVKSAMMYPLFLMALSVVVIAIIMTVTMPVFSNMYASLGAEMPALTMILINVSRFVSRFWWLLLLIIVILIVGFRLYSTSESGKLSLSELYIKLPILGRVTKMNGASQFANTLSTLLASGIQLISAVSITSSVMDNAFLGDQVKSITPLLAEGQRLGQCLQVQTSLPELLSEMAAVGEETGFLEETLETIAAYFDNEVDIAVKRALELLQPIITLGIGIIIGVIVIALYLPMFTMYEFM